jgi:lipoprotein-anchoring transpeptidase ErfK/SrfK
MAVSACAIWFAMALAAAARARAQDVDSSAAMRVAISIAARRLWVIGPEGDTLHTAPVAVGSGRRLRSGDRSWTFNTPRGSTTVVSKETDPVWIPPDWHYVEIARKNGLSLENLSFDRPARLKDGSLIVLREGKVGVLGADSVFQPLPVNEEIVFGSTLYVPPLGSLNRRVDGPLGAYRLLLANGVGLHGTPDKESIGRAATHGCIRLFDEDIAWLYEHVQVGARVLIF